MDELLSQFLIESRELIGQAGDDLEALGRDCEDRGRIDAAFRAIHTLKGSVAIFDMAPAGKALHAAEDLLEAARAGRRKLDRQAVAALVAVLDQSDRWIDAMEREGKLAADAVAEGDRLTRLLAGDAATAAVAAATEAAPPWLPALLARHADCVGGASGDLVAFRYTPDPECFFLGVDPLAIVAEVPGLVALSIEPVAPWSPLEGFEPFQCASRLDGLSAAPLDVVRTAFRLVGDQVETGLVDSRAVERDEEGGRSASARSIRVEVARIDALADGVGELIVAKNALAHLAAKAERLDPELGAQLRSSQASLERAVGDMRDSVMAVRMVPLGPSLRRLPRMVREIAASLDKPVQFTISGEATEVDKGIADELFEPLLHLVRNAMDHGIEPRGVRRSAGKVEAGRLRLDIRREGDGVVIALADDGAGMDPGRIRAVAVERGLIDAEAAASLENAQLLRLIFRPGFSTAATVNPVSGRGVGMDAVQAAVDRLGGRIEIDSHVGEGTTIRIRLPMNAIMTRLLIVRAGGDRYGIPLDRIVETAIVPSNRILPVGTGQACVLRDRTLPLLSLASLLGGEDPPSAFARLLVTEAAAEPIGVIVQGFDERIDGLVRPKTGLMAAIPGVAGTTLLGDGGVLLVLDIEALVG